MTRRAIQSEPATSAASRDLRHPGCIMRGAHGEEIHEFMGMWLLKPNADLVVLANDAVPRLNLGQIRKMADWYQKTQKFHRAVAGDGATSRTKSKRSSPSWPSLIHSCRAAPTSTPTLQTSRSSVTFPSAWA
jgi:hypothetical protein